MFKSNSLSILGILSLIWSCQPEDTNVVQPYDSGVVVVNEGAYGKGNGSLSFINRNTGQTTFDVFSLENNRSLGDVVQSYSESNGKGFVVVNNSNKVEMVDARTFKSLRTFADQMTQPRYAVIQNNRLFVSCWDNLNADFSFKNGWLTVVDLATGQVIKRISLGKGPERIMILGNELYVSNSGDNTLSIVDLTSLNVSNQLAVGQAPNDLAVDANGKLWVLCKGKNNEKSTLVKVNPTNKSIESTLPVGSHSQKKAGNLTLSADRKTMFFTYNFYDAADGFRYKGEVYSADVNASSITAQTPLVSKPFYGLGLDPSTGILYGALAPGFSQSGYVYRYAASNRALVDSIKVEIGPNGFFFK